MITKCLLAWYMAINSFSMGITPTIEQIELFKECDDYLPQNCVQYSDKIIEKFAIEDVETVVKIIWCESRFETTAHRYQDITGDSGLVQAIPMTWGWVENKYDIRKWDMYDPIYGFVQFNPEYNLKFASYLLYDMNSYTNFNHWNSSKWCWENTDKWLEMMRNEQ